jgi:hypothetical protein
MAGTLDGYVNKTQKNHPYGVQKDLSPRGFGGYHGCIWLGLVVPK